MTSEPISVARQATFNAEPADTVSEGSIRRGSIQLPVVDSSTPNNQKRTSTDNNNNNNIIINNDDDDNGDDNETSDYPNALSDQDESAAQEVNLNIQRHNAPASNQSSPIYGSKSGYEKFNKRYAAARTTTKPQSLCDDSSDLEILSDVGLADDSDCDVVPVITPLSLSAKKKIRKAPRIKVPSAKVDNAEPTIQEETTQDILNIQTPENANASTPVKSNLPRQLRSQTVVFEKLLETVPDETVVVDRDGSISNQSKINPITLPKAPNRKEKGKSKIPETHGVDKRETVLANGSKSNTARVTKDVELLQLIKDDLESSFCESDWQPRKPDQNNSVSLPKGGPCTPHTKKNIRVAGRKTEHTSEPLTAREEKVSKTDHRASKRPLSAGDQPKSKEPSVVNVGDSSRRNSSKVNEHRTTPPNTESVSRPQSRSVRTPLISNFLTEGENKATAPEGKPSDSRSTALNKVASRTNDKQRDFVPPRKPVKPFLPPSAKNNIPDNMETSDGYDYESETFEEILKDRNAMVKAERTYQKRIKQLEEELKGMINQCQALSDENKGLRKTIDSLKKKEKDETKPDENESTIELASRIAKLETEKENLKKTNEKLSLALKDDGKKKPSDVVFVENTKLKNKNSELEKRVHGLQSQVDNLSTKIKELGTEDTGKSAVLDFKNKELEVAIADLRYENRSLHSKVKSLENEKHLITNSLEEKRVEINEMMRAMQNETVTETELKQSKVKLEEAQGEIDSVKNELEEMKKMLQASETKRGKIQNSLTQRESDLKRLRTEQDTKDKIIGDLRMTTERLREEVNRHEGNHQLHKDMERETAALKSRIGSLKAEIESSISENQRLKFEREEANHEIDRLRNETAATAEAVADSRRYFRKWEVERDTRNKAEVELAKKQDEIDGLHSSLKDSGMKMNLLYGRLRAAEEEKERFRGPGAQELETNNKILKDENKKLRQMLIEKNVELLNKTNEKELLDNRIGILERKQKDSETRVRQLSGWVGSMNSSNDMSVLRHSDEHKGNHKQSSTNNNNSGSSNNHSNNNNISRPPVSNSNKNHAHVSNHAFKPSPMKRTGVKEPIIAVISPRSRKKRTTNTLTPPPTWDDRGNFHDDGSNHTPLSLPLISESKPRTPTDFNAGYFQLYKERMKKVKNKQFAAD